MAMVQAESDVESGMSGNDLVARAIAEINIQLAEGPVKLHPIPSMIRLPAEHESNTIDYHAVARDRLGRIYVLYNSHDRSPGTRALARFHYHSNQPNGHDRCEFDTFLGTRDWADGTPHGMNISCRRNDDRSEVEELLTIVNNDGTVILADLEGKVFWRQFRTEAGPKAPTTAVATASGSTIGVVDGYGTNSNFVYSGSTGQIFKVTGSEGSRDGQSLTNHGVDLDPDGNFVVADRGNTRLTWWSADTFEPIMISGTQKKLEMPGLEVCNVSFLDRFAVVPCLNSRLAFLAPDHDALSGYKIASVISMPSALIAAGIDGIHDAEFTADGRYVIVSVWERNRGNRRIPTLTAFKLNWPQLEDAINNPA
jgi:hypothetical protein